MKKLSIIAALALATMWTWTPAIAGINASIPYFPAGTPSIGASSAGTMGGESGLGNAAGSIAAGANSALNPSGNSFIVPPPGASAGVFIGPRR
jgi:hypothetical protein